MGTVIGMVIGAMPGLSPAIVLALILSLTFTMDPNTAILMLLGIFCSGIYAGSVTAILISAPGTGASICTVDDGYSLTKQGKPNKALKMSLYASTIGGLLGAFCLLTVAKPLAKVALAFGPQEFFGLLLFALILICSTSSGSMLKGLLAATVGILLATVGLDPIFMFSRFSFGSTTLESGFRLIPMLIGLFALTEVLIQVSKTGIKAHKLDDIQAASDDNRLTWQEFKSNIFTIIKGGAIGTFIGALPGPGQVVSAYTSYIHSKRTSKNPELYGHGSIEGIAAAESANNGSTAGVLIPLLTLGVPGDAVTAILLGTFVIHDLAPGPMLFRDHGDLVHAILIGVFVANIFMFIFGSFFAPLLGKLVLKTPRGILFTCIGIICIAAAYGFNNSMIDVWFMLFFGVLGFFMHILAIPRPPLLIAFLLGSMIETALRNSLIMNRGSLSFLYNNWLCAIFMILSIILIAWSIKTNISKER